MPSVHDMKDRPEIYETDPLIEQLKDLDFYFQWINKSNFQPAQSDWEYYLEHKRRLQPLEDAWRAKRRAHMITQARPFLEYVNPIHAKLSKRMPEISQELFRLLDIYDAACEFYVSLESETWTNSQALRAEQAIRRIIKENFKNA